MILKVLGLSVNDLNNFQVNNVKSLKCLSQYGIIQKNSMTDGVRDKASYKEAALLIKDEKDFFTF